MSTLFPENSYTGKCLCGKNFIATKSVIHCHNCLYAKIAELEKLVDAVLDVEHERGGSLHASGQFLYKTPESVFKLAKQLREVK